MITARELRNHLEELGLVILHVSTEASHPTVFVVYLHGNANQWFDDFTPKLISEVPGVRSVKKAEQSRSILVVEMVSEDGKGGQL